MVTSERGVAEWPRLSELRRDLIENAVYVYIN
jgi:hypothetical protein